MVETVEVGRRLRRLSRRAASASSSERVGSHPEVARDGSLSCDGLGVRIGAVAAVDDVTLAFSEGEILGLIGPNGAGKTTLLNAFSGYIAPTAGCVFADRNEITGLRPDVLSRQGLVRTFQGVRLFEDLSVLENVEVAALSVHRRRSAARAAARQALRTMGLAGSDAVSAGALPYGAQRQAAIARAIATQPRFLLLDEPAAGLNQEEGSELVAAIRQLAKSDGMGVLLVDHDMQVVMGVSDRIHVLDSGRTISEGLPAAVQQDPVVISAYLGLSHDA